MSLRIVARTSDVRAECPVWNRATGLLHWIGIERGLLYAIDEQGASHRSVRLPERIGSLAFRDDIALPVRRPTR